MADQQTPNSSAPLPRDEGLHRAVNGDYDVRIGAVFDQAWRLTDGNKWTAQLAGLYYGLACLAALIVVSIPTLLDANLQTIQSTTDLLEALSPGFIGQLLLTAFTLPLSVGLFMNGLKLARQQQTDATDVFRYFAWTVTLFVTWVVMSVLIALGALLFIIPGIYLAVAWLFALPLVVERGLGPWQALETSRKALTHRWFSIFAFVIIESLLGMLGILTLGIALIWIFPWLLIANGLLYQQIFGAAPAAGASQVVTI